jgi:hypothetical protein
MLPTVLAAICKSQRMAFKAMSGPLRRHSPSARLTVRSSRSTALHPGPERKYSPGVCIAAEREVISGNPDEAMISTSHVERMNLNMRMGMRRFTRLTNAFSKKYGNHCDALALYFFHYNFCRQHKSLRVSLAMRRFTRLANAFSKKYGNHCDALALYFFHYTFAASTSRSASLRQWPQVSLMNC